MKNIVSEHRTLALVISGVVALVVGSTIVGSLLLYHVQKTPNPTVTTETSGCTSSLTSKEKTLYILSRPFSGKTVYISAVDTNGQERWTQNFTTIAGPARGSLEEKDGLVYAFVTSYTQTRVKRQGRIVPQITNLTNTVAAYDANSGKKLWNIQVPANSLIDGMSTCNNITYLWTGNVIYAYNAKNGTGLWETPKLILLNNIPRIVVTNNAIVFMSRGIDIEHDTIYALNPKNSAVLWKANIPNRSQNGEHVALSVTATDKAVYVSQFNKGTSQKVEALSISNGKLLWNTSVNLKIDTNSIGFPFTIVGNNVLYLYTSGTGVVALNVNNGTHLWEGSNVNRFQPLEDRLYVTHDKASDFCQLDPITGKSQWCQSPIATNNPMEAVSNQTTLYIASPTGVSALQKNNGKWVYKNKTFGAARMLTYGLSLDY